MLILVLIRISIFILASFSAISAVVGLGSIFQAIFWPIVIVGIGLELAKYTSATYAVQEWPELNWLAKSGLVGFIVVLTLFTSVGIFGYLGTAFQNGRLASQQNELQIKQLTVKVEAAKKKLAEIDTQIQNLPSNTVKGRVQLLAAFDEERSTLRKEISASTEKLEKAQQSELEVQVHLGPIVYLASLFDVPIERAVNALMLILTACLDPFALFLTLISSRKRKAKVKEVVREEMRMAARHQSSNPEPPTMRESKLPEPKKTPPAPKVAPAAPEAPPTKAAPVVTPDPLFEPTSSGAQSVSTRSEVQLQDGTTIRNAEILIDLGQVAKK